MSSAVTSNLSKATPYCEHAMVRLVAAHEATGLDKGAEGTIVHIYGDGLAFEVEFFSAKDGHEIVTLEPQDLTPF